MSQAGSVGGDKLTFTATEYYFRVIAVNAVGPSDPLTAKDTTKPTRPLRQSIRLLNIFTTIFITLFYLYKSYSLR